MEINISACTNESLNCCAGSNINGVMLVKLNPAALGEGITV